MMKRIWALGLAMVLLVCSGFVTLAAANGNGVQPHDSHVHDFSVCKRANAGYSEDRGVCEYLYGYDQNRNPIYKNDCRKTDHYEWCNYICRICGKTNDTQGAHSHFVKTTHSVNHP